jgi:phenylacetate-CoA ligase
MRDLRLAERLALVCGAFTDRRFMKQTPLWPRDRIQAWQFDRVRQLVTHAFHTVPFYRRLYKSLSFHPGDLKSWDDFHRLPVVTKDQVIDAYPDQIVQEGIDREQLIISRSSGSSGKVLDIAYGDKAMTTYIVAGLRLYEMGFDYRPWHRQVYVYTSPYPLGSLFGLYPLHFVSTLAPIATIIAELRRLKPQLVVCYPSHLKQIAQEMTEADRQTIGPRAISVNSEMSTQKERDELAAFFRCPVLDEYSSEELTRIAAQCRQKCYHIFEDINYLETLDGTGQPAHGVGTIVGTNLHNFVMPMIRYQQNDLGEIELGDCPCGWKFRTLKNLQGRQNDSFVLPSGRVLTSGFLLDATYEFLLAFRTAVKDFCLIQHAPAEITLEVVPAAGWSDEIAGKIRARFAEFLEPAVHFQIQLVEQCHKTKTGKRNPIVNLMTRT